MQSEHFEAFEFPDISEYFDTIINNENQPFWVFGYGSLLWFPDFESDERVLGFVDNVKRVMSQASYRLGTDLWPGRVATLLPHSGGRVWGAAYKISGLKRKRDAFQKLKIREIDKGYQFCTIMFHPMEGSASFKSAVYIALPNAPTAIIDVPLELQAYQILLAKGPIGENRTYLLKLAKFLEDEILSKQKNAFDPHDDLIIQLSRLVKEYENNGKEIPESQKHLVKPLLKSTSATG